MADSVCPLCGSVGKMAQPKKLYDTWVCRGCHSNFANLRQIAFVIDAVVWRFVAIGVGLAIVTGFQWMSDVAFATLAIIVDFLIFPALFFCKDGFGGCSLGKAICGVQVVDQQTLRPAGFRASFKRNLPLIVPLMALVIGLMLSQGFRLGDGWSKTRVIWKKYAKHPVFTGATTCAMCQYDLTGNLSGTCPECGTPANQPAPLPLAA